MSNECDRCGGVGRLFEPGSTTESTCCLACDGTGYAEVPHPYVVRNVIALNDRIRTLESENETLRSKVAELEAENAENDEIREVLAGLLRRTAVALKGPEPPLKSWSWHDLPELVEAMKQRAETAEAETDHLMDALIQQENALNVFVRLLNEALDEDGTDTDFDDRLADARAKLERLSDWRTRDMLCLQSRQRLQDAEARLADIATSLCMPFPELATHAEIIECVESKVAQLAKVRELPGKWREGGDYIYRCLAAELESLLTDKAGSGE